MTLDEAQTDRELKCYGRATSELDAEVERWGDDSPHLKLALSYLSDAQEELDLTSRRETAKEQVRQRINCAKYLIDQHIVLKGK